MTDASRRRWRGSKARSRTGPRCPPGLCPPAMTLKASNWSAGCIGRRMTFASNTSVASPPSPRNAAIDVLVLQ